MALTPTEREEHFFKAMVDASDGSTPEELEPTERKEHWYKEIIDAIAAGGGGSGGAVSSVNGKTGNVMLTAEDVGAAEAETVVAVSGATPTITPAPNTIYNCGEVESLTISNPPTGGAYSIVFTSGATPTDLSVDPAIKMPDGFSVEANKRYEINVLNRWAVAGSWAVSE